MKGRKIRLIIFGSVMIAILLMGLVVFWMTRLEHKQVITKVETFEAEAIVLSIENPYKSGVTPMATVQFLVAPAYLVKRLDSVPASLVWNVGDHLVFEGTAYFLEDNRMMLSYHKVEKRDTINTGPWAQGYAGSYFL